MKKIYLSMLGVSLLFGQTSFAMNNAQEQQSKMSEKTKQSAENLKQVEGTIIKHKFVNVFKNKQEMQAAEKNGKADQKMLVVMLKTSNGNDRLIVDLGKIEDISKIKDGKTKLQVEGKMVTLGNEQLFVAKRAKLDGTVIDIQRKKS